MPNVYVLYIMNSFNPRDNPWRQALLSHFIDDETEAQRG